jgi:tetratricopeptide (TPR) repeat protein
LGLFYQWDLRDMDLKESINYLLKAIEKNPVEQEYWLNLARVLNRMGEKNVSEEALEKAIRVFPFAYQGRWVAGNLFLQGEDVPKALPHFSYLLRYYPEQSSLVYDVLLKVVDPPDFLLEKLVPEDAFSLRSYLSYLYENNDSGLAKKAWEKGRLLSRKRIEVRRFGISTS